MTTLAGLAGVPGSADGTGSTARFNSPSLNAMDSTGNIYVGDSLNNTIRKVTPAGVVTTLAGLAGARGSADGTGSAARFNQPQGVALDSAGNVYVADYGNFTIRKVTPAGVVTTLAGLAGSPGSADGTGSAARFNYFVGIAVDSTGNIYISDYANFTIRKVTPAGVVTTLAGLAGSSGSTDGIGSAARFNCPYGLGIDSAGNLYVADEYNDTIREVTQSGVVTTLGGLAGNPGSTDGTGSAALFNYPIGVAVDSLGNIYIGDYYNNTLRKGIPNYGQPIIVDPPQDQSTFTGSNVTLTANIVGNAPLAYQWQQNGVNLPGQTNAALTLPNVQTNSAGSYTLTISNALGVATSSPAVLSVSYPYTFITLAGQPGVSGVADGPGSTARFNNPFFLALDGTGNLYVGDSGNNTIRIVTPAGVVTTLAGSPSIAGDTDGTGSAALFNGVCGVAVDSADNIYVADFNNNTIRKVTPAGVVTTFAGGFDGPRGVAVDSTGNVYVADQYGDTIRKVTPAGVMTTLAGSAGAPGSADGTGSAAQFHTPFGLSMDSMGNIYVADYSNDTIREVTPLGVVTTLAGLAGSHGGTDGLGSAARFYNPSDVALDSTGNLYVADNFNNTIRKITPAGVVTTVAGQAGIAGNADGTGSTAQFDLPTGIAVDSAGNLYVADYRNNTIRKGIPNYGQPIIVGQPQSQTLFNGNNTTLTANVIGPAPLSYQWQFNGVNLAGQTNATLSFSNPTAAQAGAYNLVITNLAGSTTSATATLTFGGTLVSAANLNSTWTAAASPYFVGANFVANDLVIQPGVSVLFNGPYSLTVTGLLQAVGASNSPITFAGAGGGNWQGLRFVSANTNSTLAWCVVEGSAGGGIRFTNTPFTLTSCLIVSNTGVSGGGIYSDSPLLLQNCGLLNNAATYAQQGNSYSVQGGGLFSLGGGVTLQSCLVSNNTAIMSDAGVTNETSTGGGLDVESGLLTLLDTTVISNQVVGAGQSSTEVGGGVYLNNVAATLSASGSVFAGNRAPGGFGGALALGSGGLTACVLSGNQATFGGALWIGGSAGTMATNCILAGNAAALGGAVYSSVNIAAGDFENCTVAQNSPDAFNAFTGLIHDSIVYSNGNEIVAGTAAPFVSYCDVRGGYTGPGTNNLNVDPQFADTLSFQLAESSPMIDAGDPAPQFDDAAFPPSQGSDADDLGAYGGPGAAQWPAFNASMPVVLVNGQPAAPFQVFTFPASNPPVISFTNGYAGGFFEYTLDGSNPLDYSTYTGFPLVLTNSANVRLVAYSPDIIPYSIAAPVTVNVLPGYNLAAGAAGGGGVTPAGGLYLSNSVVALTATNLPGWTFLNWTGDASGTNNPVSVVVNGSKNVQAVFGTALTMAVAGNGMVQTNPVQALYPYGSTVQLLAVPNNGSSFFRLWGGAAAGGAQPLELCGDQCEPQLHRAVWRPAGRQLHPQPVGQRPGHRQPDPAGRLLSHRFRGHRDGRTGRGPPCLPGGAAAPAPTPR